MWREYKKDTPIEWDIYLSTVCDLKSKWLAMSEFEDPSCKLKALSRHMPRYIWVADAIDARSDSLLFTFLFDATDIENSELFIAALHYTKLSFEITRMQAELVSGHKEIHESNYQAWKILFHHLKVDSDIVIKPTDTDNK